MSNDPKSTLSEKFTAAATIATAIAAAKTAKEAAKARQEMAAMNRTAQIAADNQQRIQLIMASEQAENNFRNTVLAALPLLKSEQDREQFLEEQFLPKLKESTNVKVPFPFDWVLFLNQEQSTIETYLKSEAGQDLKEFLSTGNHLRKT